eukprot:3812627-Rhodomonas_salina.1
MAMMVTTKMAVVIARMLDAGCYWESGRQATLMRRRGSGWRRGFVWLRSRRFRYGDMIRCPLSAYTVLHTMRAMNWRHIHECVIPTYTSFNAALVAYTAQY